MSAPAKEDRSYNWQVTHNPGGHVILDLGDDLTDLAAQVGVTPITVTIGEALIKIGTKFLQSRVEDDEEDW